MGDDVLAVVAVVSVKLLERTAAGEQFVTSLAIGVDEETTVCCCCCCCCCCC